MKFPQFAVPLRFKIILLITGSLSLSLYSYFHVATNLIITDKISYIYEYNLTRVKSASEGVEGQIYRILTTGRLMTGIYSSSKDSSLAIEKIFADQKSALGISSIILLEIQKENQSLIPKVNLGDAKDLEELKNQSVVLGWKAEDIRLKGVKLGRIINQAIPMAGFGYNSDGGTMVFITAFKPSVSFAESSLEYELNLVDWEGSHLTFSNQKNHVSFSTDAQSFEQSLVQSTFLSGVTDWTSNGVEAIVAYQKLAFEGFALVGYMPKSVAFTAADALKGRSFGLGISILVFFIGIALIFSKELTNRIRELWLATQRVSQGDFSFRVRVKGSIKDEMNSLAVSFNSMSSKISELLKEAGEKARMEKELETAQILQKNFFPKEGLQLKSVSLFGSYLPASECAGDWWNFAQIRNYLLLVIGDATGHGASAALLTAAVHGALSVVLERFQSDVDSPPSVEEIITRLNNAVILAIGGASYMTMVAGVVDLDTGLLSYINASHCTPFVIRGKKFDRSGSEVVPTRNSYMPLVEGNVPPLGMEKDFITAIAQFQLEPNDLILLYTDGLTEVENTKGKALRKKEILAEVMKIKDSTNSISAKQTTDAVMAKFRKFIGGAVQTDDVTVVITAFTGEAFTERSVQTAA